MRILRLLPVALAVLAVPAVLRAEEGRKAGATNEEKLQAKLAEPWLSKHPWMTDYDLALEEARKTGKPIFGYFTRSYAG